MSNMSEDKVFEPINDLFEEMCRDVQRLQGDTDLSFAAMKIVLMKAYQRGQSEALDKVRSWL